MIKNETFVLALDAGTQSSRALLMDPDGNVVGIGRKQHAPMLYPEPGAVEQNPADILDCLFYSIRHCVKDWGGDPGQIAGAALTTQRSCVIATDSKGAPLRDAVSWLDRRTAGFDSEPSRFLRTVLKAMGKNALIPRLLSKSVPRQWRERNPELFENLSWVAPLEAWLLFQMTGQMAIAPGGIAGPWPFDCKKRDWADSSLLYTLLGFEKSWLPKIVEPGDLVGKVTEQAAEKTGLKPGMPIFACGGDKQAEALGAGVRSIKKGVAAVSLGTGSSISIPWEKPVQHRKYNWITMASAEKGSWSLEYLLFRGLWTARWFADELGHDLVPVSEKTGRPVEALLCDEAEKIPAGSDGLVTWPRWSPTLQHPFETGTAVGFREIHTRGHFFRSLLEGIAYDLKRGMGILERATGSKIQSICVGGGGSRSDVVVQILADVLGLPVSRPPSEELAARGAAIVAAAGSKVHATVDEAIDKMVPEAPVVQPDPESNARYEQIYRRVYLPGLRILRKSSNALTSLRDL